MTVIYHPLNMIHLLRQLKVALDFNHYTALRVSNKTCDLTKNPFVFSTAACRQALLELKVENGCFGEEGRSLGHLGIQGTLSGYQA